MKNININTIFQTSNSGSKNDPISISTLTKNNPNKNIFNHKSLSKVHKNKKKNKIKEYDKIFNQCLEQIQKANETFNLDTFFIIPDKISDFKEYNKNDCIEHIIKKIRKNNIDILKVSDDVLFITWINLVN